MDAAGNYADNLVKAYDAALREAGSSVQLVEEQESEAGEKVEEAAKYSLDRYSQHQLDNWKNSKVIETYDGDRSQVVNFVERSVADKTLRKKLYFGRVSADLAEAIYSATGVDTTGFNLALYSDEVTKILADHGNESKEAARGQRAVNAEDFATIVDVVTSPDSISLSKTELEGKPVIEFVKTISGKRTVVTYVSTKHNDLRVQTMYISAQKKSLATPLDEQASNNTPEASSGTAPTTSIPTTAEDVKPETKFFLRQTETPEFKRWFGKSKVVNPDGTPKVMYHGTPLKRTNTTTTALFWMKAGRVDTAKM